MSNTFEVYYRRKIPYWSSFLLLLCFICSAALVLLCFAMSPSERISGEMKVAYYILIIPNWLKKASSFAFLALGVLVPIYMYSKRNIAGIVSLNKYSIAIGDKTSKDIPVEKIGRVIVNDVRTYFSGEKTEIILKQRNAVLASFVLKYYSQSEEFIDKISTYTNIQILFYNEIQIQDFDENDDS